MVDVAEEIAAEPDMLGVGLGDEAGGAIAQLVRCEPAAEPGLSVLGDREVEALVAKAAAPTREPEPR